MKSRGWKAEDAYAFVKERRGVIRPNKGFIRQLETFQGMLNASNNRNSFRLKRDVEIDAAVAVEEEDERLGEKEEEVD